MFIRIHPKHAKTEKKNNFTVNHCNDFLMPPLTFHPSRWQCYTVSPRKVESCNHNWIYGRLFQLLCKHLSNLSQCDAENVLKENQSETCYIIQTLFHWPLAWNVYHAGKRHNGPHMFSINNENELSSVTYLFSSVSK